MRLSEHRENAHFGEACIEACLLKSSRGHSQAQTDERGVDLPDETHRYLSAREVAQELQDHTTNACVSSSRA